MALRLRPAWFVAIVLASAALLVGRDAAAHAKLRSISPSDGTQLDRTPSEIKLTFTEPVEVTLSSVKIVDPAGSNLQSMHGRPVAGDRRSCVVPLGPLEPGAYVIEWRVVSADGHAMTGTSRFTIRGGQPRPSAVPPAPPTLPSSPRPPRASRREMVARWLFITGVAGLLGAAAASAGGFGGQGVIAAGGWILALLGTAALADAQRRTAGTGFGELLNTSIGHSLVARAAPLLPAGLLLLTPRSSALRRPSTVLVIALALAAMGFHAAAGHAAAVERFGFAAIGLQWLHFAAAGVWLGGLAALLAATRGAPDVEKTAAVQRYSTLAGIAIVVVGITGVLRTAQELASWNQLVSSDYGQAALAKAALLIAIGALGALNRWHSVPAAATSLRPLRRFALIELALMIVVLGVAAILATLSPPE